ncbi:MAG: hypothetical protein V7761_03385 [Amylibacter sp.]
MMENKPETNLDIELAAFFDAAKDTPLAPDAEFLEAVAADALGQTEDLTKTNRKPQISDYPLAGLLRNIGGWQSVAAMTACACIGIFAGYTAPNSLDYFSNTEQAAETLNDDSFSVASDIETLFQEG